MTKTRMTVTAPAAPPAVTFLIGTLLVLFAAMWTPLMDSVGKGESVSGGGGNKMQAVRNDRCRASRQKPSGPPEIGGKPGATNIVGTGAQRNNKRGCSRLFHVGPGFAPVCGDSTRSLRGEPGTSFFQGGCQTLALAQSFFQLSVCEPDRG